MRNYHWQKKLERHICQLLHKVFAISRIIKVEVPVINESWSLRPITLTETLIILYITKLNLIIVLLYIEWRNGHKSHVFASSLMGINTKCTELIWSPLKIMHSGHTLYDYPWPWVSLTWLLYNLQLDDVTGADFESSLNAFG